MITIEKLKKFGANTDEGLGRCLNDENFYLTLVESAITFEQIDVLSEQILAGDLDSAFESAHAMKGVFANLSLDPIYKTVCDLTEHLRIREQMEYSELMSKLRAQMSELKELSE